MLQLSLAIGKATLADRLAGRGLGFDIVLIGAGAALTAIAAQATVPLATVPFTGQTFAVLLVGNMLGALRGALSMAVYVLLGVAGLPIFSNGWSGIPALQGQTGGYLIGFIAAAAFTGWMAQRAWNRNILGATASTLGGTVLIYLVGLPWLAAVHGFSVAETLAHGLYPLMLGDVIKLAAVALIVVASWTAILRAQQKDLETL